jgi:hypothetical protein
VLCINGFLRAFQFDGNMKEDPNLIFNISN